MKLTFFLSIGFFVAVAAWSQNPPPAVPRTGPGVQATQDAKEPELLKTCKFPLLLQPGAEAEAEKDAAPRLRRAPRTTR